MIKWTLAATSFSLVILVVGPGVIVWRTLVPTASPGPSGSEASVQSIFQEQKIEKVCSKCHRFPKPEILPRSAWPLNISNMYTLAGMDGQTIEGLHAKQIIEYYQSKAPEKLELPAASSNDTGSLRFVKRGLRPKNAPKTPAISNVNLVSRGDGASPALLLTDMRHGHVFWVDFAQPQAVLKSLFRVAYPCKTEVFDLDRGGRFDILVPGLGSFEPEDHHAGSLQLLRQTEDGNFRRYRIAKDLGRVTDARPCDVDGDGDLDIIVAVFGWLNTGEIFWLENRSQGSKRPVFVRHEIDERHGAIHIPLADLNGDGREDFVALFSQEYESLVAFMWGPEGFTAKTLYEAPHPNWGSSSLELVDMDGDGDLDALVANGDTLDDFVLKPYHGVQWLENDGEGLWKSHPLAQMYGVHRALARDMDGDGDKDVVACSFLPHFGPDELEPLQAASLMWIEQVSPGVFVERVIERLHCFHATLDVGDIDADGDLDIVVGCFTMAQESWDQLDDWVEIWVNQSR